MNPFHKLESVMCSGCHECDPSRYPALSSSKLDRLHEDFHNFMQAFSKDIVHLRALITGVQAAIALANAETHRVTLVVDDNFKAAVDDINAFKRVVESNFEIVERRFRGLR